MAGFSTDTLILQICAIVANILIAILGTYMPYFFGKNKKSAVILDYLNMLSGGILAGASYLHMLAELSGALDEACNGYPVSWIIYVAGLLAMVWISRSGGHSHDHGHGDEHDHEHEHEHEHDHHHHSHAHPKKVEKPSDETPEEVESVSNEDKDKAKESPLEESGEHDGEEHALLEHSHIEGKRKANEATVIVLLVGLAVHALSAGLSLGLARTFESALSVFLAIALHKGLETMAASLSGIRNLVPKKRNIIMGSILACVTPLGQIIGIILVETLGSETDSAALDIVTDIMMAFACGTFATIVAEECIIESLPPEKHNYKKGEVHYKMLTFIGGFAFMAAVSGVEMAFE